MTTKEHTNGEDPSSAMFELTSTVDKRPSGGRSGDAVPSTGDLKTQKTRDTSDSTLMVSTPKPKKADGRGDKEAGGDEIGERICSGGGVPTKTRNASSLSGGKPVISSSSLRSGSFADYATAAPVVRPKVTCNLNRWALLLLFVVYCFICGPAYFSWASLRSMLYTSGAYEWECDQSVRDVKAAAYIDPITNLCRTQQSSVQLLFMVAAASHFFFSAVAGLFLDSYGPKVTAIGGVFFQMLGWFLLGSSRHSFQAYIPGVIILGMGVDAAFFPCIVGANLFPKYTSFIIAVLGAARSASFYIIYIMEKIVNGSNGKVTFQGVTYVFAGLFLGFCLLVAIFFIPMKPYEIVYQPPISLAHELSFPVEGNKRRSTAVDRAICVGSRTSSFHSYMGLEDWKDIAAIATGRADEPSSTTTTTQTTPCGNAIPATHDTEYTHPISCDGKRTNQQQLPTEDTSAPETGVRRRSTAESAAVLADERKAAAGHRKLATEATEATEATHTLTRRHKIRLFVRDVCSVYYLPVLLFFCFTLQRCIFFGAATNDLLPDALEFFKVMSPLSFLPCPLLGFLADKWGIMLIMMICNAAGTLLIGFSMIPGIVAAPVCQYFATIMYCVHVSFLLSQCYCYIADTFSQENMGKLIGLMCAVAGLISLTAFPMYDFSLCNSFYVMMGLLLATSGLNFAILGFVWIAKRRRQRKVIRAVETLPDPREVLTD